MARARHTERLGRGATATWLVVPSHLLLDLRLEAKGRLNLTHAASHWPHVSVEAMDRFRWAVWNGDGEVTAQSVVYGLVSSLGQMSLSLVRVSAAAAAKGAA